MCILTFPAGLDVKILVSVLFIKERRLFTCTSSSEPLLCADAISTWVKVKNSPNPEILKLKS